LIRPALYKAYHRILPTLNPASEFIEADIVGPVCESGDSFAENRELPAVKPGDCLAILTAGAYASSMSSEYNSRPKCAEVLVSGEKSFIIRQKAELDQLIENETIPDIVIG
ncbi:diaminopimelate decarboxylase, partial [bacterium]|nr:diaminopimelate decarboxylase [bacterium]